MASLVEVMALLRGVRSLRFEARTEAATGWTGVGIGTVVVLEPLPDVVVFEEAGSWQPSGAGRAPIAFNNVFRWSAVGEALRLEHLRFGLSNPVLLFDMAPGEGSGWREISPHQCREDCYTATLLVVDGKLLVAWSIQGPRKRESIRYTYW